MESRREYVSFIRDKIWLDKSVIMSYIRLDMLLTSLLTGGPTTYARLEVERKEERGKYWKIFGNISWKNYLNICERIIFCFC